MEKIIGVTELQRKFRPFFEGVVGIWIALILTRRGISWLEAVPNPLMKTTYAFNNCRRVKCWPILTRFGIASLI